MKMKKLNDGGEQLARRSYIGHRCISLAKDGPWTALEVVNFDDQETYAKHAIADILTALFGPAGTTSEDGELAYNEDVISQAHTLLYNALQSYRGDAEDYEVAS